MFPYRELFVPLRHNCKMKMGKNGYYTLEKIEDKYIGVKGTPRRDAYEDDIKAFLIGDAIKKARKEKHLTRCIGNPYRVDLLCAIQKRPTISTNTALVMPLRQPGIISAPSFLPLPHHGDEPHGNAARSRIISVVTQDVICRLWLLAFASYLQCNPFAGDKAFSHDYEVAFRFIL